MKAKELSLLVTALTVLTNIVLFYVGGTQTISCTIAKMAASVAMATSTNAPQP